MSKPRVEHINSKSFTFKWGNIFCRHLHSSLISMGQGYKTFYHGNLPPFHVNNIILCYKAILPWKLLWNGSKFPRHINPRKSRVRISMIILPTYCFITLAPRVKKWTCTLPEMELTECRIIYKQTRPGSYTLRLFISAINFACRNRLECLWKNIIFVIYRKRYNL